MSFEFIILALVSSLFSKYLLDVFFLTPSPAQWTNMVLRKKPGDKGFMYTRDEFETFSIVNLPYGISALIGCRFCLSLHVTFWVSLLLCAFYAPWSQLVPLWLLSVGAANLLHKETQEGHSEPHKTDELPVTPSEVLTQPEDPSIIRRNGATLKRREGTTNSYVLIGTDPERDILMEILKNDPPHENPEISTIQSDFRLELEALKQAKPGCPQCEQNSIMHKHYERLRTIYNATSRSTS